LVEAFVSLLIFAFVILKSEALLHRKHDAIENQLLHWIDEKDNDQHKEDVLDDIVDLDAIGIVGDLQVDQVDVQAHVIEEHGNSVDLKLSDHLHGFSLWF